MTVEIMYDVPQGMNGLGAWQIEMAVQIEENRGFPISSVERELDGGSSLIVRVDTSLPSAAVENMLSDIEAFLPSNATHVETREVD